jgi:hypothetical protein|uniref:Uncharacterized protein n=1 Tax=viral metagenome TaxID=1070528 RepID=A0A6C0DG40_9ZZZZ
MLSIQINKPNKYPLSSKMRNYIKESNTKSMVSNMVKNKSITKYFNDDPDLEKNIRSKYEKLIQSFYNDDGKDDYCVDDDYFLYHIDMDEFDCEHREHCEHRNNDDDSEKNKKANKINKFFLQSLGVVITLCSFVYYISSVRSRYLVDSKK